MKVLTYQQVVPPVPDKVNKVKYLGQAKTKQKQQLVPGGRDVPGISLAYVRARAGYVTSIALHFFSHVRGNYLGHLCHLGQLPYIIIILLSQITIKR